MKRISCILLTAILFLFSVNIDIYAQAVSGELGNVAVIKKVFVIAELVVLM